MITSTSNVHVKQLIQLQKKPKERNNQDVFIVEGIKMFREVPKENLVQTYVSESFYSKNQKLFGDEKSIFVLSDRVFEAVSDTKTPQGVLCLVRQSHYRLSDLLGKKDQPALVMALENLQDPGNLGTILRTAEGAGVTGILMSSGCVDIYNPKVIRSTMGSIYRMPFYYSKDWFGDLDRLKMEGIALFAAHLKGKNMHDGESYLKPSAFLIGNESKGLSEETAMKADTYIRIPMSGQVESLNASIAAGILMYEANRQRRNQA